MLRIELKLAWRACLLLAALSFSDYRWPRRKRVLQLISPGTLTHRAKAPILIRCQ